MRVTDEALAKAVRRQAAPDAYTGGDGVEASLARAEREAAAFRSAAAPPAEPPQELLEGADLGAELATRARWLFRLKRRESGGRGRLAAHTKAPAARWAWMACVFLVFGLSYLWWLRGRDWLAGAALGLAGQCDRRVESSSAGVEGTLASFEGNGGLF